MSLGSRVQGLENAAADLLSRRVLRLYAARHSFDVAEVEGLYDQIARRRETPEASVTRLAADFGLTREEVRKQLGEIQQELDALAVEMGT